jgi:Fanconi anemia group M protein
MESIKDICTNLLIEKVEVRTEKDQDVLPYIQQVKMRWVEVEFPESSKAIQKLLHAARKTKLEEVQKYGYCRSINVSKGELLGIQAELQKKVSSGEREFEALRSMSLIAEALKIEHALELLETQGLKQLNSYFQDLQRDALTAKTKAVKNLVLDENFKSATFLTEQLLEENSPNLKLDKLKQMVSELLSRNPQAKAIVFTQYRDSAEQIVQAMEQIKVANHIFVGQAKKNGLGFSQKQQKDILDKFRAGEFNLLIATSVAEEGLDIPKVDQVIFYEPIPSAIRSIQRRGRTGRLEQGEVWVLVTKDTRDEIYRWASHHKEKKMYRNLQEVRREFGLGMNEKKEVNTSINDFNKDNKEPVTAIVADHREKNNKVIKELIDLGMTVKTAQLESADYVVSGRVGVELKKVPDFVSSIIDRRMLDQVRDLKKNFDKAMVIIEGEEDLFSVRNVHPNAIRGMMASIVLDFGVPLLWTKNPRETAGLLAVIAQREQNKEIDYSLHVKKPHALSEQQEFFVCAAPSVGLSMAKVLLEHFGSVRALVNASREELLAIKGVGEKTADRLLELFEAEYGKGKN